MSSSKNTLEQDRYVYQDSDKMRNLEVTKAYLVKGETTTNCSESAMPTDLTWLRSAVTCTSYSTGKKVEKRPKWHTAKISLRLLKHRGLHMSQFILFKFES